MKQIINDKLYDTEKAENIYSYRRKYKGSEVLFRPGYFYYYWADVDIYKTKKGNYFLLVIEDATYPKNKYIEEITEDEVKRIIKKLNADKYLEIFKEVLEDA